jgi:tetratricopeptide (TPR) repeat protein
VVALFYAPAAALLAACVFITLAPTSSFVPIATEVGAERRMYLPLVAIVVGVVLAWDQYVVRGRRTTASLVALVVVSGLLAAGIVLRDREYASALVMAQTIVDRWPSGRAHYLLGTVFVEANRHDEAMAQLRESAKDYPGALYAIGTEEIAAGRFDAGIAALRSFIAAMPGHLNAVFAHEMLAHVYAERDNLPRALEEAREVVRLAPQYARGHDLLARVLATRGDIDGARSEFEEVVRLDPGNVEARQNLAALPTP